MLRATKARVWRWIFITGRNVRKLLGVLISIDRRFHWGFSWLRCDRVGFSRLHNPRNTQKTTYPGVMAGAIEAPGTERATAGSVRFYKQCFLPEYYARLSRPEGCVVITSRMIVSAPLVAGEIAVSSADRPVAIEKHHSAFPRSVCTPPFESLRSRQY
jgi:hypothetical protein